MPTKKPSKVEAAKQELTVYLPDTRGVTISPWGRGNTKIGMDGVYTYSRLPGRIGGTCPGATPACQDFCYAKRVINTPPVSDMWEKNSGTDKVPLSLPDDAKIVRIHVSGDFDTVPYIESWIRLVRNHPNVRFFGYTRSWRVEELLPALERLHAAPNVQLFASVDTDMDVLPPQHWRRAWLEDDLRAIIGSGPGAEQGLDFWVGEGHMNFKSENGSPVYVCPEETGRKPNCQSCNYCITGKSGDVVFLLH